MRLENLYIYNTPLRCFRPGSVVFSEQGIERVEWSDKEEGTRKLFLIPGLIDIHMHIESSMLTASGFSEAAIKHGTTAFVSDSHEVSNVFGEKGLLDFMSIPSISDAFYALPSSVPASSGRLETSGGSFDEEETFRLAEDRRIIALGEVMNASDLLNPGDNRTRRIIKAFRKTRPECPVEGHCPRLSGSDLAAFIASGVDSDHTEQTPESIKEKITAGMFLEIQYKSLTKANIEALSEPRYQGFYSLCTDDVMPDVLINEGQLDRVIRKAISLGLKAEDAIFASTYSPSRRMRLFDRGIIAPGRIADFVLLSDPDSFEIESVWKSGREVYEKKRGLVMKSPEWHAPDYVLSSTKREHVTAEDFSFPDSAGSERIVTIKHFPHTTMTGRGEAFIDLSKPLPEGFCILASVERYGKQSPVKPVILENGFRKKAAIASSWAHDSHNILVMATDGNLAADAVNRVIDIGGGIVALDGDKIVEVPLSYGGIVSLESPEKLAERISLVRAFMRDHGYEADEEIMSFAVLALPVSPELKVTDKGLVDVRKSEVIEWRLG